MNPILKTAVQGITQVRIQEIAQGTALAAHAAVAAAVAAKNMLRLILKVSPAPCSLV